MYSHSVTQAAVASTILLLLLFPPPPPAFFFFTYFFFFILIFPFWIARFEYRVSGDGEVRARQQGVVQPPHQGVRSSRGMGQGFGGHHENGTPGEGGQGGPLRPQHVQRGVRGVFNFLLYLVHAFTYFILRCFIY